MKTSSKISLFGILLILAIILGLAIFDIYFELGFGYAISDIGIIVIIASATIGLYIIVLKIIDLTNKK